MQIETLAVHAGHPVDPATGAVRSPFECWLTLRGIRTLPLRVRAQAESALRIATFLAEHPAVCLVRYPGLATHPGHAVAARQMTAFGGVVLVELNEQRIDTASVAAKLRIRATSLGGTEGLLEQGLVLENPEGHPTDRHLRLSIGLEHPDDLLADLAPALARGCPSVPTPRSRWRWGRRPPPDLSPPPSRDVALGQPLP